MKYNKIPLIISFFLILFLNSCLIRTQLVVINDSDYPVTVEVSLRHKIPANVKNSVVLRSYPVYLKKFNNFEDDVKKIKHYSLDETVRIKKGIEYSNKENKIIFDISEKNVCYIGNQKSPGSFVKGLFIYKSGNSQLKREKVRYVSFEKGTYRFEKNPLNSYFRFLNGPVTFCSIIIENNEMNNCFF